MVGGKGGGGGEDWGTGRWFLCALRTLGRQRKGTLQVQVRVNAGKARHTMA